jgi:hypothetical protein
VVDDRIVGVPGHEQDLQVGAGRGQPLGESTPVELGHDHVGQDEVDRPEMLLGDV